MGNEGWTGLDWPLLLGTRLDVEWTLDTGLVVVGCSWQGGPAPGVSRGRAGCISVVETVGCLWSA